eukprot:12148071-Ditylum_brightwellii.AAC.1
MALLLGNVPHAMIKMVGFWHSNTMLCYLHTSAHPISKGHVTTMARHGNYFQIPISEIWD